MLQSFDYGYDNAGNRTSVLELSGARVTWTYDAIDQLLTEQRTGGNNYNGTMTYDEVGNRTSFRDGSTTTTYTYDAADQLTVSNAPGTLTTYTFDAAGNLQVEWVGSSRTTHTWDEENRLTQVEKTGMTTNAYTFNGDGQRVRIVDSVATRRLIWDEENILLETDDAGSTQAVYTYEPAGYGRLVSQRRSNTSSYHLFDALGSADRLMDSAGTTALNTYVYRAYGALQSSTGVTVNPFRWVGELGYYYDLDRLSHYVRARTYNPRLARWLSRDPLFVSEGVVSKAERYSSYAYAYASPIVQVDPSGKIVIHRTSCVCAPGLGTVVRAIAF